MSCWTLSPVRSRLALRAACLALACGWMMGGPTTRNFADEPAAGKPATTANKPAEREPARPNSIDFNRDILPILSNHCLLCHGPDAATRAADLRLDRRETAIAANAAGRRAIVPGKPDESELLRRVRAADPDERMPPAETMKPLTNRQIELLRQWIAEGAAWSEHWAFVPPRRPAIPATRDGAAPPRTPLDALVAARLARESLELSPAAPRETLLRRLTLDLTGLPPTLDELAALDALSADAYPDAVDRQIDRLLASPRAGERWAMWWLDLARYSDTDGYQGDDTRRNWPWRDWVIDAFNRLMPLDDFTRLQLAGDLAPNASPADQLATCFQRNHMTNGEGGRDPEESRIDYVLDRVNTLGAVWLGLTVNCCQCHNHKYDPLTQADYYQLSAFFNSIDEDGRASTNAGPYLKYKSPRGAVAVDAAARLVARRKAELDSVRAVALAQLPAWLAQTRERLAAEPSPSAWRPLRAAKLDSTDGSHLTQEPDGVIVASGPDPHQEDYRVTGRGDRSRVAGLRLEVLPATIPPGEAPAAKEGEPAPTARLSRGGEGHFVLTLLKVSVQDRRGGVNRYLNLVDAVATHSADKAKEGKGYGPVKETLDDDPRTGWSLRGGDLQRPHVAVFALAEPIELNDDEQLFVELGQRSLDGHANLARFRLSTTDQVGPTIQSVASPPLDQLAQLAADAAPPEPLIELLRAQFLAEHVEFQRATQLLARAETQANEAKAAAGELNVMVLKQRAEPRPTHVLTRGVWNQKGDEVRAATPSSLAPWPAAASVDRNGLVDWLMQRDNPLPSRVLANQLWQNLWGAGLVRTAEDFGLQGERPAHVETLDWLAVELVESGWDWPRALRAIASSDTYRQSSTVSPELAARDPENRLLARGARYRLPAWMIRDATLAAAGLLDNTLGGAPVRPYQPPGVWEENFMGRFKYEPSEGGQRYRRTIYAFWRRSIAPTFLFDAAQRRVCEVKTVRTNTPLQALTLLNDQTTLEAAQRLAAQSLAAELSAAGAPNNSTRTPANTWSELWRRVLGRAPTEAEQAIVERHAEQAHSHYSRHPQDARRLLKSVDEWWVGHGEWTDAQCAAFAARTVVASMILNLDEAMTRE